MQNTISKKWILIAAFLLASGGFLAPFWPLEIIGILVAVFGGVSWAAVGIGLLLDLAYGAPQGFLQYLYFPFTIGAVLLIILRFAASKFIFERGEHSQL